MDRRDPLESRVIVVIVGFRNAGDIISCLKALSRAQPYPPFDVIIAENGGAESFARLLAALEMNRGFVQPLLADEARQWLSNIGNTFHYKFANCGTILQTHVQAVEMPENLGYAGAINACLRSLLCRDRWHAAWILNPDTEPTPTALFELEFWAIEHRKGMVGSKITPPPNSPLETNCGLRWNLLSSRTTSVYEVPTNQTSDETTAADAPSGASIYVTRVLMQRIGLMDERYFLYFEDLEWGLRAKRSNQLGFAARSIIQHIGGTTLGSFDAHGNRSRLSVYLDFRNRILFVKHHYKRWLLWTAAMQIIHLAVLLHRGTLSNVAWGGRGVIAGLRGEVGRPEQLVARHSEN